RPGDRLAHGAVAERALRRLCQESAVGNIPRAGPQGRRDCPADVQGRGDWPCRPQPHQRRAAVHLTRAPHRPREPRPLCPVLLQGLSLARADTTGPQLRQRSAPRRPPLLTSLLHPIIHSFSDWPPGFDDSLARFRPDRRRLAWTQNRRPGRSPSPATSACWDWPGRSSRRFVRSPVSTSGPLTPSCSPPTRPPTTSCATLTRAIPMPRCSSSATSEPTASRSICTTRASRSTLPTSRTLTLPNCVSADAVSLSCAPSWTS